MKLSYTIIALIFITLFASPVYAIDKDKHSKSFDKKNTAAKKVVPRSAYESGKRKDRNWEEYKQRTRKKGKTSSK